MKERPILFKASMVNAILEGRKTQTRRIAKPRTKVSLLDGTWSDEYILDPGNKDWLMKDFPFGNIGDRLWVKETSAFVTHAQTGEGAGYIYAADGWGDDIKWTPSIFMKRNASRITLEIEYRRLERVSEITDDESLIEGACLPDERAVEGCYKSAFAGLWDSINAAPKPILDKGVIVAYEAFPFSPDHAICQQTSFKGMPLYVHANPLVWVISFSRLS